MEDFALRIKCILRQCSQVMDGMVSADVSLEFDLMIPGIWDCRCPLAGSIVALKEL